MENSVRMSRSLTFSEIKDFMLGKRTMTEIALVDNPQAFAMMQLAKEMKAEADAKNKHIPVDDRKALAPNDPLNLKMLALANGKNKAYKEKYHKKIGGNPASIDPTFFRGSIKPEVLLARGGISEAEVLDKAERDIKKFERCFDGVNNAAESFLIQARVAKASGNPRASIIRDSPFSNPKIDGCILALVKRWNFTKNRERNASFKIKFKVKD